jgi:hypothetical protein
MLPTPKANPDPFERQGPDSGAMRRSLVPLFLVVGTGPEEMPRGFCRPFDERVSQERGALEAPVAPGCVAAAIGHRRNPGVLLELTS